jgi:hypothetical protein
MSLVNREEVDTCVYKITDVALWPSDHQVDIKVLIHYS